MTERIIAAAVHGRCLVIPSETEGPAPMIIGFHGYGENADIQLERLRAIPECGRWLKVSVQALHRFYERRSNRVVGSWMTRQDRETAIADNITYVTNCIDEVAAEWVTLPGVVFAGFSQGVAMAFRAAMNSTRSVTGVIAVGGDVPPELTPVQLKRVTSVLIARGTSDEWYTEQKFGDDQRRLRDCCVDVHALEFSGGHDWPSEVVTAASDFLRQHSPNRQG